MHVDRELFQQLIIAAAELRAVYKLKQVFPRYVDELEALIGEATDALAT